MAKTRLVTQLPTTTENINIGAFEMDFVLDGENFVAVKEFDSNQEAKDYLRTRAKIHHDNDKDPDKTEEKLNKKYDDINQGSLTLDGIKVDIVQGNQPPVSPKKVK